MDQLQLRAWCKLHLMSIICLKLETPMQKYTMLCGVISLLSMSISNVVSEPNPLRPLRDLQYGLGETVFGRCRHLEHMNI